MVPHHHVPLTEIDFLPKRDISSQHRNRNGSDWLLSSERGHCLKGIRVCLPGPHGRVLEGPHAFHGEETRPICSGECESGVNYPRLLALVKLLH